MLNGGIMGWPQSFTGFCHTGFKLDHGPDLHDYRGNFSQLPDRTYPMNLSEDLLSLGGNQLLFLCSFSLIFAAAKAPHYGRCEDAQY
jgi:hypothetical protein